MNEIVFLGTSGSMPTKDRGLSAIALKYGTDLLLFDCGEGTQRQMMKYKVSYGKVNAIFITHLHLDHFLGLTGLLHTLNLNKRVKPLHLFGPENLAGYLPNIKFIKFHPLKRAKKGIFQGKDFFVDCFKLKHSIPTFGFIFREKDRVKFKERLAKSKGLKGPMFTKIQKKGRIKAKGKWIKLEDISYVKKGRKILFATDTSYSDKTVKKAKNAHILVHDAAFIDLDQEHAVEKMHTTAKDAALLAKKAGVEQLILFHISPRYKDGSILEKEAKKYFKNSICSYDGLKIKI